MMMASFVAVRAVRAALNNTSSATVGSLSITSNTSAASYATKSNVTKQKKSTTGSGSGKSSASSPPSTPSSSGSGPDLRNVVEPPSKIFKKVSTPTLGPGAGKDKEYKNPEYFLFHNMSYADMDEVMAKFRLPQPSSLKK